MMSTERAMLVDKPTRIVIITGIGSSGKTTSASVLSKELSLPCFILDSYKVISGKDGQLYKENISAVFARIMQSCWYCSCIIEGAHFMFPWAVTAFSNVFHPWHLLHPLGSIYMVRVQLPYEEWRKRVVPEMADIRNREYYEDHSKDEIVVEPPITLTILDSTDKLAEFIRKIYDG